jgi:trehalose 6-phosphate synthase
MMAQLRENNVSVWRDNFMRDLARAGESGESAAAQASGNGLAPQVPLAAE